MMNKDLKYITNTQLLDELAERIDYKENKLKELQQTYHELEEVNEKLVLSENNKTKFLSLIRNEFKNPLFGVIPLLKNLFQNEEDSEKKEVLDIICSQILGLDFQLSNIIAVSEIETGMLEKNISLFNIATLVQEIENTVRFMYKDKDLTIENQITIDTNIYLDRDKMYIILINLLSNAYEFSDIHSKIKIMIDEVDSHLIFKIHNQSSIVIDEENVFNGFYEHSNSYNKTNKGLGIGLSIVKHYIEFIGGEIVIKRDNNDNILILNIPYNRSCENSIFCDDLNALSFEDNLVKY